MAFFINGSSSLVRFSKLEYEFYKRLFLFILILYKIYSSIFFMKNFLPLFLIFSFSSVVALAQGHEHHQTESDTSKVEKDSAHQMQDMHPQMSHAFSRNLPMNRNASGTAWLPDNSPMFGSMKHSDNWMWMFHGNVFLRYTNHDVSSDGTRGDEYFDIPNWFMGMGQTEVGERGLFRFSTMLSLEPLTIGGEGYPLLFQSGETWKGVPLVDRQHPHDLFSELSVAYSYELSGSSDVFAYLGYPGEPAFGPPAFMHRNSGLVNPDASLGHHWQDATHITFGVGTVGFRYNNIKLDASIFTGREPDEDRYDFDEPRFDSFSARISYNPSPALALQISKAWVKDVHELGSREDINKTTASAIHTIPLNSASYLSSAIVWGYNSPKDHHSASHSLLLESAYNFGRSTLYGRYEWVEKSTEDLLLDESQFDHGNLFAINAFSLGYQHELTQGFGMNMALGIQTTLYISPDELVSVYGDTPYAMEFYIRLYPQLMH